MNKSGDINYVLLVFLCLSFSVLIGYFDVSPTSIIIGILSFMVARRGKFHTLVARLNEHLANNPKSAGYTVVIPSDPEGNSFYELANRINEGRFRDGEFLDKRVTHPKDTNSICLG